jgi:hypothetical protein
MLLLQAIMLLRPDYDINYKALAEIHSEFGEEGYVSKEVPKDLFLKHVYSLIPS